MRSVIAVLVACAIALGLSQPRVVAQPAPPPQADVDHARDLYAAAEQAMTDFRYSDAVRDYLLAFDLTKDPALLYKLGVANEKAGRCTLAVVYYRRYLRDGKPSGDFLALTKDKIRACHADPDVDPDAAPVGSGSSSGSGSSGSGSAAVVDTGSDAGSGSAAPPPKAPPKAQHRAAWLLVGGAIAAATTGAVLAYSARASENDVADLYLGLGGITPTFDAKTQNKFDDLVAEGKRYEHLSWLSFGVAGVLGGIAAYRFVTDKPVTESRVQVTPTASPTGAGVSAIVRW